MVIRTRPGVSDERGFTLVEVMVVVAVMSTIGFVLLQIFTSSGVVMAEMTAGAEADARVLRTVDRLHQELEFADPDSIEASAGEGLRYRVVTGWESGAAVLGSERSITRAGDRLLHNGETLGVGITDFSVERGAEVLTLTVTFGVPYRAGGGEGLVERTAILRRPLRQ